MVNKIIVNNIYSKISNIYNVIYLKIRLNQIEINKNLSFCDSEDNNF